MSGGVAAAAAIAEANKASGAIVKMGPDAFVKILGRVDKPPVVIARGRLWGRSFKYVTSYKGLFF